MSTVTVVLPVYNSVTYLREAIESVINQSYQDWDMLVINEKGSNDGSAELVQGFAQKDSRIRLIQNEERLGLGASLNLGVSLSMGKYIARLDADDLAHPSRFEKQVSFMEEHPHIAVCGTYQHHFGPETNWIHKPALTPQQCRANLLFFCDLCHSTLMLRKETFEKYALKYDSNYLAEDYELWTRVVQVADIANIPEVLGEYRWGEDNITVQKKERLNIESGQIVARSLAQNLGMRILPEQVCYFQGWKNPFSQEEANGRKEVMLKDFENVIRNIYKTNKRIHFYDDAALLKVLAAKWNWAKYYEPFNQLKEISDLEEVFEKIYTPTILRRGINFWKNNKGIKIKAVKLMKFLKRKCGNKVKKFHYSVNTYSREELKNHVDNMTWDRFICLQEKMHEEIEGTAEKLRVEIEAAKHAVFNHISDIIWNRAEHLEDILEARGELIKSELLNHVSDMTWNRTEYLEEALKARGESVKSELLNHVSDMTWNRTEYLENVLKNCDKLEMLMQMELKNNFNNNIVKYFPDEKIRIIFYYQVASFWPSWESLYYACMKDSKFDIKLIYLDETIAEHSQMLTAEAFLLKNNLEYINANEFDIDSYRPHIIIYQTPYDKEHRKVLHRSAAAKAQGYRIVYIPYGIEITDTKTSRKAHFEQDVIINNWRLYTISERMMLDYQKFSEGGGGVRSLGHPKFDGLFNRDNFVLDKTALSQRKGKKIILWKVHFPKIIYEEGIKRLTTPNLSEYIEFAKLIKKNHFFYFIFMPHPKLFEEGIEEDIWEELNTLREILESADNVFIDKADDYRNSLLNSDYIIVDRSAVMVEAGAVGVPVLYMHNEDYEEDLTAAIRPLIESYYQGTTCKDMIDFVNMCRDGEDLKKSIREEAFRQCVPYFDGKCGERIKEDLINSLKQENAR